MNKSKVMKLAHSVRSEFTSFSDALKFAWAKMKLQTKMKKGLCYFTFTKKSTGEERDALATLNMDFVNHKFQKGCYIRKKWFLQTFWDTNLNAWRCLDVRTLDKIHW